MSETNSTIAEKIAEAAMAFQVACTGITAKSVTVLLGEKTVVVTLHDAFSPGERVIANTPAGAGTVSEYHQQLFQASAEALHKEIERILGNEVRESVIGVEPQAGRVVWALPSGNLVQVFRVARSVPVQMWSSHSA